MTEWEVFGIITGLVTFAVAVGKPIIKLNTSITQLIDRLNNMSEGVEELTARNSKSHERLWRHNERQDKQLVEHEKRIFRLEREE